MNIYALSSGRGPSGIAIIRLSGKDALKISETISQKKHLKPKEINFCKFFNPLNNTLIDEGLLLSFPGPNSFTGEDLVEFHIHGSNAVISYFLKTLSEQENCRLAGPGEFTKIAFQNNKIDLIEAESIGDLIHSETEMQRKQAISLVQGSASNYYNDLREKLIKSLAYIEAKIDFAEDDLPESVLNAGKSSLLNLLSKRDAAMVSDEKGTTRDVIEVYLNIDGYPVILADTAGIRDSENEIEKKGISLAIRRSKESDLSLIVIDNSSQTINPQIKNLISDDSIVVLNKSDIINKQNHNFNEFSPVLISVKNNTNIVQLTSKIKEKLSKKFITTNSVIVTRERHRIKLNECLKEINNFLKKDQNKDIEMAAEDLRLATRHLGEIVGKVDVEEILDSIFKDFCIGK